MTDKQFTVGVKVEADTKSASTDVQDLTGKVDDLSQAGTEAGKGLDAGAAAVDKLGQEASDAAAEVTAAAESADAATAGFDAAAEAVATVGTEAAAAAGQVGAGAKEVDALAEAFKALGITGAEALQAAALAARESFITISTSGKATQVDIDTAFAAMSAAYLKAAAAAEEGGAAQIATALRLEAANQAQLESVIALQAGYGIAARSAQTVEQAFDQLGVKSASSLVAAATAARDAFGTIQASGQATQVDLDAAFAKVAAAEFAAGAAASEAGAEQVAAALRAQAANEAQLESIVALEAAYGVEGSAAAAAGEKAAEGAAVAKEGISLASEALLGLAGITIGAELLKSLAEIADEAKNVETRLKLATSSQAEFEAAQAGVFEVAQKTGVALSSSAETFYKLSQAVKQLKGDGSDTLTVLTAINEAVTLSGVSAQTANNGIIQFAQGLASGRLQGQDLRAVLEDLPALGKAVADGLGVTVGELRKLGEQGALTPQEILGALEKAAPQIAEQFGRIPLTVGRALTELKNSFTIALGSIDQTTGASAGLAKGIEDLAKTIDKLGGDGRVKDAFNAIGSLFKALVVDEIKLGVGEIEALFHGLEYAVDESASLISLALSKVTFGDTSKQFKIAADSLADSAKEAADKVVADLDRVGKASVDQNVEIDNAIGATVGALGGLSENSETAATRVSAANRKAGDSFTKLKDTSGEVSTALLATLPPAAAELVKGFNSTGDAAGVAAKSATSFAEEAKKAGLSAEDTIKGLSALDAAGKITAENFNQQLAKVLKEVSNEDLPSLARALSVDYQAAAQSAAANTTQLKFALDAVRDESLTKLGLDAKEVITGISSQMGTAIAAVKSLGDNSETTAQIMTAAFSAAISKATTKEDARALVAAIGGVQVAGFNAAEAINSIQSRIEGLPTAAQALNPVTQALDRLGVESQAKLDAAAAAAKADFALIATSGTQGAGIVAEAFAKVADAELKAAAAAGESQLAVVAGALKGQAATDAQRAALDALIAKYPQLADVADQSAASVANAASIQAQAVQSEFDQLRASISQVDDVGKLEALKQQITELYAAGKVGAEDYQAAIEAATQAEGQLGDAAAAIAEIIDETRTTLKGLSQQTVAYFDSMLSGQPIKAAADQFQQLDQQIIELRKNLAFNTLINGTTDTDPNGFFDRLAASAGRAQIAFYEQSKAALELQNELGTTGKVTQGMIDRTNQLVPSLSLLGEQQLGPLRQAITDAQNRLDGLNASAASTLSNLQNQLDQLNGNTLAVEQRANAAKAATIEAQIAQAKLAGDSTAVNQLTQALELLKKIGDIQAEQAKQQTQQTHVQSAPNVTSTQQTQVTKVVQIQLPNNTSINVRPGDEVTLENFLQQLVAAKKVSR